MSGLFRDLGFFGEWRRYQRAALEAFEATARTGTSRTHIVAPPGLGQDAAGRRADPAGRPRALVLAPNTAIQQQWPRAVGTVHAAARGLRRRRPAAADRLPHLPGAVPARGPRGRARPARAARWADERAQATGRRGGRSARPRPSRAPPPTAARASSRGSRRAQARDRARRARGVELRDLLSATARGARAALAAGVGVVVLDECHHLASLWGYVVRAVLGELRRGRARDRPHRDAARRADRAEAELYEALLGPVDFIVPTPAVVRDGHLAPYQELAWLTEPLAGERDWLAEHDTRFHELIAALHDDAARDISFPALGDRAPARPPARGRRRAEVAGRRSRSAARARPRRRALPASGGLALPAARRAARPTASRPTSTTGSCCSRTTRCAASRRRARGEAAERYDAIAAALRELGFKLTRQGIRRGTSEVDRLLTGSHAKALGLVEVSPPRSSTRGDALRALVLCDAELAAQRPDDALTGVLDPAAGTARAALLALAADVRTAPLRPLLVSGRGLRCAPADADVLLAALRGRRGRFTLPEWEAERRRPAVSLQHRAARSGCRARGSSSPRALFAAARPACSSARARCSARAGTARRQRLVDLTAATTGVSVRQMRGRSLRLDPADPEKVASNWDVVCVAPELVRGSADYERFVRKHLHLFAPAEDGEIEAGPVARAPGAGPVRAAAGRALRAR